MDTKPPIRTGSTDLALGTPLIQMGTMLNPAEFEHRARATDVAMAINAMLGEIAIMKAEVIVLRMAMATSAEHSALLREEMQEQSAAMVAQVNSMLIEAQTAVVTMNEIQDSLKMAILSSENRTNSRITKQITDFSMAIDREIREIPKTYWISRLGSWFKRIFGGNR